MKNSVGGVVQDVRIQSLNAIAAGFGFASALAWLDFIRWVISNIVRVKTNGGNYFLLSALFTTLIAVVAMTMISRFGGKGVTVPKTPVFAVTR